jgi:hypothetical protein
VNLPEALCNYFHRQHAGTGATSADHRQHGGMHGRTLPGRARRDAVGSLRTGWLAEDLTSAAREQARYQEGTLR